MKFVNFFDGHQRYLGVVSGQEIVALGNHELEDLLDDGTDLTGYVNQHALQGRRFNADQVTYLPPLQSPPKIICIGLNYIDHTTESKFEQPDYPTVFNRFNTTLTGHRQPIVRPLASDSLDYEGEMAVVLKGGGRHIRKQDALDWVAGYSIFNDASVREYQFKSPQWTVGKNFDNTGGFGPVLVTPDELPSGGRGLRIETRLNGQVVQSANTKDMIFDVATLITLLSEAMSLEPGDIIVSGTPAGVGWARTPKLLMHHGDVCEISIEGIGTLANPIVDEPQHDI